ncbi:adenylate/guanylate cyclase domain-containing protein [Mesorhizobium sp. KR9-304]|uniref:adenylate/guanylate cyclase domain-containing protein n=1 Tax=Mesorhizobium sp. KR9-304 TaxID=3156614 RepID=UPI0032B5CA55
MIDPLIAEHRGRIVKLMGDGAIVEFASVVDAVGCAVAMQEAVTFHQQEVPPENRIVFRMGINVGDVVVEGDDLLGDGVNIAARLEALAQPGGICVTDAVQKYLAGKTDILFEDIGEQTLKNIAQPVRVWRWAIGSTRPAEGKPLALPERPSIAVLPFDNLSGQPEETYFSDGITEDIITGLARFRSLFVIARNSSFSFRGKAVSLVEIGRQLGVAYVLEGSVRRAGDRIRITAQLIEAATGAHIWADRYDRNSADVFEVQDEVTTTIVSTLVGRIEDAKIRQSLRKHTQSPAAYDYLLRGIVQFRGYAKEDNSRACAFFEEALACDPNFALAHSYLALARIALHGYGAAPAEVKSASSAMARRGVELDPQEGGCHRILGQLLLYLHEYDLAEHHARRAIGLNPNDADGAATMGDVLIQRGIRQKGWSGSKRRCASIHFIRHGTMLCRPPPSIHSDGFRKRRRRSSTCPTKADGRRDLRPVMANLARPRTPRQRSRRS